MHLLPYKTTAAVGNENAELVKFGCDRMFLIGLRTITDGLDGRVEREAGFQPATFHRVVGALAFELLQLVHRFSPAPAARSRFQLAVLGWRAGADLHQNSRRQEANRTRPPFPAPWIFRPAINPGPVIWYC